MPKKPAAAADTALFVRLPQDAAGKLHRAAEALGLRKKDLVAGLVSKYVDPDSRPGLHALGTLAGHRVSLELGDTAPALGAYSFQPYDPPEVLNAAQAADFLQTDEAVVVDMAEANKLPGRKLGKSWRFSRAALVSWLSGTEKRP